MDIAALAIAIVGLVVAASSFGWQVATWALSGRRVRLNLLHGITGRGGYATGIVRRNGSVPGLDSMRPQGWNGPEVVAIEVINVGRAPVTIRSYAVHAAGTGMSFIPHGDRIGPDLPFRLEAGESETWYAEMSDARALVESVRAIGRDSSEVFMSVSLGTKHERRTKRALRLS